MAGAMTRDLRIYGAFRAQRRPGTGELDLSGTYGPYDATVEAGRTAAGRSTPFSALPPAAAQQLRAWLGALMREPLERRVFAVDAVLTAAGGLRACRLISTDPVDVDPVEQTRFALEMLEAGTVDPETALAYAVPRALSQAGTEAWFDPAMYVTSGLAAGGGIRTGPSVFDPDQTTGNAVLFVEEFSPRHARLLHSLAALVILHGGASSHGAVVARAAGLPCVVGPECDLDTRFWPDRLGLAAKWIEAGEQITVDGDTGALFRGSVRIEKRLDAATAALAAHAGRQAIVGVSAAGEDAGALKHALTRGAVAVDLVRTENILARSGLDGRDLLLRPRLAADCLVGAYTEIMKAVAPLPATLRLSDFEDPVADVSPVPVRGCRLGLSRPALYAVQAEAALAAHTASGTAGPLRLLAPFVTFAQEVDLVRSIVDQAAHRAGHHRRVLLGAMVETPSALSRAAELAATADFLTFGLNDLTALFLGLPRDASQVVRTWSGYGVVGPDFGARPDRHVLAAVASAVRDAGRAAPDREAVVVSDMLLSPPDLALLAEAGAARVSVGAALVPCLAVAAAQAGRL
jgi:pyruvate,orthophosphate dikinase